MKDIVTLAVGKLGENITVKKIEGYAAPKGTTLYGAAHPRGAYFPNAEIAIFLEGTDSVAMGKFVSLVALKRAADEGLFPTGTLASQICQHIIGMRSETLGEPPVQVEKVCHSNVLSIYL